MDRRNKISQLISSVDAFGVRPLMTHQKRSSYRTCCGGFMSLIIIIAVAAYVGVLLTDPWEETKETSRRQLATNTISLSSYTYTHVNIGSHGDRVDPSTSHLSPDLYYPFYEGFNLAMKRGNGNGLYDPSVYHFLGQRYTGNAGESPWLLVMRYCTVDDFDSSLSEELTFIGIDYYLCFDNITNIPFAYSIHPIPLFKGIEIGGYDCDQVGLYECSDTHYTTFYSNSSGLAEEQIQLSWIDAYYSGESTAYMTSQSPIKYVINSQNIHAVDYISYDYVQFKLQRHELHDIDGRVTNFWRMYIGSYTFQYGYYKIDFFYPMMLANEYYVYNQYQRFEGSPPVLDRNLVTQTVEVTSKALEEEPNDSMIFKVFFALSQAGGLYSFLLLLIGFVVSPFVSKAFHRESCNNLAVANLKLLQNSQMSNSGQFNYNLKNVDSNTMKKILEEYYKTTTLSSISAEMSIIEYRMH